MSTEPPEQHKPDGPTIGHVGLTRFQIDLLVASRDVELAREDPAGPQIRERLQDHYDREITHGQLYPNLDTLVEHGLLAKSALDRRTNVYALTDLGRHFLVEREAFLNGGR